MRIKNHLGLNLKLKDFDFPLPYEVITGSIGIIAPFFNTALAAESAFLRVLYIKQDIIQTLKIFPFYINIKITNQRRLVFKMTPKTPLIIRKLFGKEEEIK